MTRQDLAPAEGQRHAQAVERGHIGQPGSERPFTVASSCNNT